MYDDHVVQTSQPDNMARTFVRLARDLVRIMEERTRDGYVFRTDLRLRPDPGATSLAVSVSAAEAYYGSLGQNWERAAMIKARPVAGDLQAGGEFLRFLVPSSGAAAWISPRSRTSTRSSARSTPSRLQGGGGQRPQRQAGPGRHPRDRILRADPAVDLRRPRSHPSHLRHGAKPAGAGRCRPDRPRGSVRRSRPTGSSARSSTASR